MEPNKILTPKEPKFPTDKNIVEFDTKTEDQSQARNVFGFFQTVTTIPTAIPKNFIDQIKIYHDTVNSNYTLYIYDAVSSSWKQIWIGNITGGGTVIVNHSSSISIAA